MRLFRISNLIYLLCTIFLAGLLFWTSQNVQHAEGDLAALQAKLLAEQDSIRVLEAEWVYLTRPQRLEQLAAQRLEMTVPQPEIIINAASNIPEPPEQIAPVLPGIKPAFLKAKAKQQNISRSAPAPTKPSMDDRKRFDALVEGLASQNGGAL